MKLENLIKKQLELLKENHQELGSNYMFFENIKQIKRQCELLLELDEMSVNDIINNGHDWADDHITVAKEKIDDVFDFFMNQTDNTNQSNDTIQTDITIQSLNEAKHKPTNPKLWAQCQAWARRTYKVHPSAYSNAAASKRYKQKGGGWKTIK